MDESLLREAVALVQLIGLDILKSRMSLWEQSPHVDCLGPSRRDLSHSAGARRPFLSPTLPSGWAWFGEEEGAVSCWLHVLSHPHSQGGHLIPA